MEHDSTEALATACKAIVDSFLFAVAIITRELEVVHLNPSMLEILPTITGRLENGALIFEHALLEKKIKTALFTQKKTHLLLKDRAETIKTEVLIFPFRSEENEPSLHSIIYVFNREHQIQSMGLEASFRLYGLSAGEIRVLQALMKVINLDLVATSLSLTMNTIRTHLRRIFQKMQIDRQSSLVRDIMTSSIGTLRSDEQAIITNTIFLDDRD